MKKAKLAIFLTLCAILLVAASVFGTLAYLTSTTETAENTFTVGNVTITLDEAKVDEYGVAVDGAARVTANSYKLVPATEYVKDPTIHVAETSEPAYIFAKVENGIATIETTETIAEQMARIGWTLVDGETDVYYYKDIVDAREAAKDVVVFEGFTVGDTIDEDALAAVDGNLVKVTGYAIQSQGFESANAAWAAVYGA